MEPTIKTILPILLITCFTVPVYAEERDELDGKRLVCRRVDMYFSRPYYLVFENGTVFGPWVTIDTPLAISKLQRRKYQTTDSIVFWSGHTLWRDTLRLESLVDGARSIMYGCEVMDPKQMGAAIQNKEEKLKKLMKDDEI